MGTAARRVSAAGAHRPGACPTILGRGRAPATATTPECDGLAAAVELFKALAAPTRLAVVARLSCGPQCVHELGDALRADGREVSQPLLSQHLKVLRTAGVVTGTRRANEITYQLIDRRVARMVSDAIHHVREKRS